MFFAGLEPAARARLLRDATTVVLGKGELLWKAGDEVSQVGIVLAGRLKVSRRVGRREVILDIAVPGDVVGEVALVLGEQRVANVTSIRRARVLLLGATAVRKAFREAPGAQATAMFSLGRRVQRLFRLVEDLSSGDVGGRLAGTLVGLASRVGERLPDGVLIPLRLRRADLASLAATTPESVSRRLAAWQRMGLLVAQPAGFVLRDIEGLRQIAAGETPRRGLVRKLALVEET